ncbi:MAG TPA: ABC transporter permease [Gemmatimonadales bacterium]|jgi:predicted permease|nr:ABC transporter permease [Gemmatimonadales bacterium]
MKLFRSRQDDQEMEAEMRFHVEMEAAELERMGIPAAEARRRALASFGGVRRFKEEGHEARGAGWLEDLLRDVRYAFRSLRRSPGYLVTVVLTLALGIAANTSIFSIANGVLLKPLPYREPERLMILWDGLDWMGVPEAWVTGPEVVRLRREARSFEGFAALRSGSATLDGNDGAEPQQVRESLVSAVFFRLLGTGPNLGRGFADGEDAPGAPPVAVVSHQLWRRRFGGDSSLLGRRIQIDGRATTVVGVLPPSFRFSAQSSLGDPSDADLFRPIVDTLASMNPNTHSLGLLARVRPTASVTSARAELAAISQRLDAELYGNHGFRFVPVLLQERLVRQVRPALLALLAAVAVLILIMGANLAVLALARAARREHEFTVRRAIGAGQARINRQLLTETILVALLSGGLGALLGTASLRGLLALAPAGLPRRAEIGIDLSVLLVTLGLAVLLGLGMALAPVLHSRRTDLSSVLRERTPSRSGTRLRHTLVLVQLALSMVLLAATGLLLASFVKLTRVDPGATAENVLTIDLMASRARYATGKPVVDAFARYAAALRTLPGVQAAGASTSPPFSGGADQSGLRFPSSPTNTGDPEHDNMLVDTGPATTDWFKTMGITVLAGQEFTEADQDSMARVVLIDELVAKRYFPSGNSVGQVAVLDGDSLRVVGVVGHVRLYGLQEEGRGQAYVPHGYLPYRGMTLAARTAGNPLQLANAARGVLRAVDPAQPIIEISTLREALRDSLAERRLVLSLVGGFAGAALLLVVLGVYGVTASAVTQRTRELGIRVALGADRRQVVWAVLGEPARLVALGVTLGLAGTLATGRVVHKMLYDVSPSDPLTLTVVAALLCGVALLAGYFPARRATRADPMETLRSD